MEISISKQKREKSQPWVLLNKKSHGFGLSGVSSLRSCGGKNGAFHLRREIFEI
jgi:hypothetical protein